MPRATVKNLQEIDGITEEIAREVIRRQEKFGPLSALSSLSMIDGISHGLEYVAHKNDRDNFYNAAEGIEYLNMGDLYLTTVLWDRKRNAGLTVGCVADIIEKHMGEYE